MFLLLCVMRLSSSLGGVIEYIDGGDDGGKTITMLELELYTS